MYLPGGCTCPGGVPAQGVYLPGGVHLPRGEGVPAQRGVPAQGGVYLTQVHAGIHTPPPREQNDRQVQKYYLAPNFVCGR